VLSLEENEMLTRVGPGTPMGELFRRFWLPALITSEIQEADGVPVRLRLLGEDLVAFRDTTGKVGIVGAFCPHKLAPLFFGRNEESGIRCVYHGWKFDADGNCVDMPNEIPDRQFKDRIIHLAYPTQEQGGVVWIYMGPADKQPAELPQLEWVRAPEGYQHVTKWLQRTNWAQGMEGEIDTAHISFLHQSTVPFAGIIGQSQDPRKMAARQADGHPQLTLEETPYGFTYGARRSSGADEYYWRVTRWLLPFYSLIPGAQNGVAGRAWVPIDDEHTWTFGYQCRDDAPYTQEDHDNIMMGGLFPPRIERGKFVLKNGYIIDSWLPVASLENDFLIDREMQKSVNFTGIFGANEQDRGIQEGMYPIVDRTKEHLGTTDIAAVSARRMLLRLARELQAGNEPEIVNNPDAYRVRAIDVISGDADFADVLEHFDTHLGSAKF
jgi:phthalate 4,5-dioxygenase